ncbi:helix-turn-helix domain-containing protein [Vreelandella zhanjiangensis]|uniref:helix-turn-helix domain-containing protein n=1 Tax=Halomonas hibernica TaxID=2591147 RepID=UPI001552E062|nr:helix-turn-helix domain-containing protein [Halomonas hibernica]
MQFTITEAAKIYGKQRKTLYRHIDSGRLSAGVRGDGKRVIDLAELIRCYGEPPGKIPTSDTHSTRDDPVGDTLVTQALIEELRKQTAVIERMSERIEQLEQALLRLPAPANATPAEPAPQADIEPAQSTLTQVPDKTSEPLRDFGDVLKRFENRTKA